MNWRESTEELAAENFGLKFTHIHTHTLIYVISSAIFYCLSEDQFYSELLKRAGLEKSQV